jgi:hypothetical protein
MIKALIFGGLFLGGGSAIMRLFGVKVIPDFHLFGISFNWLTAACVVAVICMCIWASAKNPKFLWVMGLAVVMFLSSTALTEGLLIRADINRRSEVIGQLRIVNVYEDFDFHTISLDPVFDREGAHWVYRREFNTFIEFDGTANKYNMLVNNRPADITLSNAGIVFALYRINFFDLGGNFICEIPLEINLRFSQARTTVEVRTAVGSYEHGYLLQYVESNGLRLRLIEEQHRSSFNRRHDVTFIVDGVETTQSVLAGNTALSIAPQGLPPKFGYTTGWSIDGQAITNLSQYLVFRDVTFTAIEVPAYRVVFEGNRRVGNASNNRDVTINLSSVTSENVAGKNLMIFANGGIWGATRNIVFEIENGVVRPCGLARALAFEKLTINGSNLIVSNVITSGPYPSTWTLTITKIGVLI